MDSSARAAGSGAGSGAGGGSASKTGGSVLVLRALGLGDLLTGLPALRALRRHFPQHELVLAAPERLREVVEYSGCADRLLPTESHHRAVPRALTWSGPPPDAAVNLHGSGPQSLDLLRTVGAAQLLSFGAGGPVWDPDEHERLRWCRLLRWYGIDADPDDFLLRAGRQGPDGPRPVVIHPGADAEARRWPVERYAQVAAALKKAGVEVVITAGRGEGRMARDLALRSGLGRDALFGGDRDVPFGALADLVGAAGALVSGDTGLAHVAVAMATPSVTLYGPVSPALWGPPRLLRHITLWHPDPRHPDPRHPDLRHPDLHSGLRPGDPGAAVPDERLLRISVGEVLEALAALIVLA